MGQQVSRSMFDNLLTKTHVGHALLQPDETHNDIPIWRDSWETNGLSIFAPVTKPSLLILLRSFQRAYMDYFSMENGRLLGNSKSLALSYLLSDNNPMIYGLFGGFGQPLVYLSDAIELQSAVLVVESLVLTAVDWSGPIFDLLSHPQLSTPAQESLPPEAIFARVAYDGRLGGLMKSGPGYHKVSQILSNENAKMVILDYTHQLDIRNLPRLLNQLARLSVLLLCGAHKADQPAFDYYLSSLPTFVCSLKILLESFQDSPYKVALVRGVWLLILLSYVTQLRPIVDPSLISATEVAREDLSWESVFAEFHSQPEVVFGKYRDAQLLRCLRSLQQLGNALGADEAFYLQAAWKLIRQWKRWTGLGHDREELLNIRL
ncbi:hypothetical protein GQ53DRAFT_654182 [Thozetella sp. PMI_491]|nr:hypothetical protein GQ53DRAFT_654182 [Thozetella sp. PMI_491]